MCVGAYGQWSQETINEMLERLKQLNQQQQAIEEAEHIVQTKPQLVA